MLATAPISMNEIAKVFDHSNDCVKLVGPDGRLKWMNEGGLCAMEIENFDLVREADWASFWPEESQAKIRDALQAGVPEPAHLTAFCPTAKGTPKWWDVSIVPVFDELGDLYGYIATSRDVTTREARAHTRDLLVDKLKHRNGNVLTLASMLVHLHGLRSPENETFSQDMCDRISALGRAQAMLGSDLEDETDQDVSVEGLLPALIRPMAGEKSDLHLDVEPGLTIPASRLDVVSIILSELAVTACRHGAFQHCGRVALTAAHVDEGIEILWSEKNAVPVTVDQKKAGQGLSMMGRIAAINDAEFHLKWHPSGVSARLLLKGL